MIRIRRHFKELFPFIQRVDQYLQIRLEEPEYSSEEGKEFLSFCKSMLVAIPDDIPDLYSEWVKCKPSNLHSETDSQRSNFQSKQKEDVALDKLLDALLIYLKSDWKTQKNALVTGYKTNGEEKFKNTFINQMKRNKHWASLLERVGEEQFCKMLLNTVVLCLHENGAFYQLTGEHLTGKLYLQQPEIDIKKSPKSNPTLTKFVSTPIKKRSREEETETNNKKAKLSRRQKRKSKLAKEIDASKKSDSKRKSDSPEIDSITNRNILRTDMFYNQVFCAQNTDRPYMGLPSSHLIYEKNAVADDDAFISSCVTKIFPNECNSFLKKEKHLKRLRQFSTLLSSVSDKHRKHGPLIFIDSKCPKRTIDADVDRAASTHNEVHEFIFSILKKLFPSSFWGSAQNLEAISKALKQFISRHKNEPLSLKEALFKFKTKECSWLIPTSNTTRLVPNDLHKREKLLSQAMFWLFNDYIKPILRHTFYITEHAKHSNRVFYFRKDVWHKITKSTLDSIKKSSYIPVKNMYQSSLQEFGIGKLRLIPKKEGFRPISNMKYTNQVFRGKVQPNENKIDTNTILQPALNALNLEKQINPGLLGSSVLGKQLFYEKLKSYKEQQNFDGTKFYFVKVDIANCFESIDQKKLLDILDRILDVDPLKRGWESCNNTQEEKIYYQRQLAIYQLQSKRMTSKSYSSLGTANSTMSLADEIGTIPDLEPGSIIIDKDNYFGVAARELRDLLNRSITENNIKIGDNYYKRVNGIAQGSTLSTLLCSFFFGDFEKQKLSALLERDKEGVLFSYVDDYLYITRNKGYANWFKNAITHELPKYDKALSINKKKCSSNITDDLEEFTWLGYRINCKTLDVCVDRDEKNLGFIKDAITTEYTSNPGHSFYAHCFRDIKSKMFLILMDTEFNSKETVLENLYDNFLLAATKLESRTTSIAKNAMGFVNQRYISTVIMKVAMKILAVVPKGITVNEMMTQYFKAFYQVYLRKQTKYTDVVYCLKHNYEKCRKAATVDTLTKKRKIPSTSNKNYTPKKRKN